ncbi:MULTISPECIES: hypothetical protein [unclassified Cobetia]|uniref:hypothetical protein n=1 Tax=unclassified Cobetia TaxID=2609414 RepID=UPI00178C96DF|nr:MULTISPECIES: hypothetical protein [unclassified Cobetia]MBE2168646.1 hypothetical protein [Cobetia sp. 2AS1]MDH2447786.1 hypothetical protein [Cobetia sp. 2AS]
MKLSVNTSARCQRSAAWLGVMAVRLESSRATPSALSAQGALSEEKKEALSGEENGALSEEEKGALSVEKKSPLSW